MKVRSPLANFTDSLDQVRRAAKLNAEALANNEAATRAVLVDPVLRILGWDTGNPNMVEVEKTLFKARFDYALFDSNGDLKVIVEAKRLGTDLADQSIILSLVNYAFTSGVKDVFLTDGIIWQHFTEFEPGNLHPSQKLNLEDEDLVGIAAYFVQRLDAARYWPEEKDVDELSRQIEQLESSVASIQKELARLQASDHVVAATASPPMRSSHVETSSMVLLAEIENATGTRPTRMRLPDGTVLAVGSWSDILREACKFAMENNPDIHLPMADRAGRKIKLLGLDRPPKGISYVEVEYQGQPVFIYTNYDSNNCIANAIHVLSQVPKAAQIAEPAAAYS